MKHPVFLQIEKADKAIVEEDYDSLMKIYAEDALLVVEPGRNAVGREQILKAFKAIASYFENGLIVEQGKMELLESGNTAIVYANTIISSHSQVSEIRQASYVFTQNLNGDWLCVIDNSYGHKIIDS